MTGRPNYREKPYPTKLVGIVCIAVVMLAALTILHGFACDFSLVDFGPVIK